MPLLYREGEGPCRKAERWGTAGVTCWHSGLGVCKEEKRWAGSGQEAAEQWSAAKTLQYGSSSKASLQPSKHSGWLTG